MNSIIYNCNFLNKLTYFRQYRDLTAKYEGMNPSHGKRKRKAIAEKLRGVLEEFEAKADQIYALYDVVEGARQEGLSRREWLEL